MKREKFFSRWVSHFIIPTQGAYDIYKSHIPKRKLHIIYDSINLDEFTSVGSLTFRHEFRLGLNPAIGLIGRIIEGKGQKEFVLAAKKVLSVKRNARFFIVGGAKGGRDNYYNSVVDLVRKEGLEREIVFTGWRNDITNVIADLDIVVQASTIPEGFGLTVIEAMAFHKPVVASDIAGPAETVKNGESGFLIPPGDTHALADKILYLLDNPHVAKKMGAKGRAQVEEFYNIKTNVKKLEDMYEHIL